MGIKEFSRAERVAQQLHRELADIVARESSDPRFLGLTISGVDVSTDLSLARIYITPRESTDSAQLVRALSRASGFLRQSLAKRIRMRKVPRLAFVYDPSLDDACRIAALLESADGHAGPHAPSHGEIDDE